MGALTAFKTCLAKTLVWKGRTSRSEYGWFVVATCILIFLVGIVLEVVSRMLLWVGPILSFSRQAILLLLFLPSLILLLSLLYATIRRLHDRGWSGWWALSVIALVGSGISLSLGQPSAGHEVLNPALQAIFLLSFTLSLPACVVFFLPGVGGFNRYGEPPDYQLFTQHPRL